MANRLWPMTDEDVPKRVVVLTGDLMDRSKIEAAFPSATVVRSLDKLLHEALGADLVLVDLARIDDPAVLAVIEARVVAYGSHVDESVLAESATAGAESMPRSLFFRRLVSGDIC